MSCKFGSKAAHARAPVLEWKEGPSTFACKSKNADRQDWYIFSMKFPMKFHYMKFSMTVITKIILGVPDKMSGRPSALCRTFWAAVRHFPSWWLANIIGHSCFPCQTFHVYRTLLKCPARSELSAGHQQKSAGHVRHISQSLYEIKTFPTKIALL